MTGEDRTYSYDVFSRFTERLPAAGDRLFVRGRDLFLAKEVDERNYRLLQGYKRAGDILIQRALADPYDRDNLVFPAIFNYRHYIELAQLKADLERGFKLTLDPTGITRHTWQARFSSRRSKARRFSPPTAWATLQARCGRAGMADDCAWKVRSRSRIRWASTTQRLLSSSAS